MSTSKISPKVLAELNRQVNQELSASHAYLAMSVWCDDQKLKGFARYFAKQADEERVHARKIMTHLLDRGVPPELAAISAPKHSFKSLLEIAQQALAMEQTNT